MGKFYQILDSIIGKLLRNRILAGFVSQIRLPLNCVVSKVCTALVIYGRQQRRQCLLLNGFENDSWNAVCCLVYAVVFTNHPPGQRAPDIINAGDIACTEETFFDETYGILNRAFTFRICLVTHPEFQLLFSAEVIKYTGFYHFPVRFAGDEYGILVNDKFPNASAKSAECHINGGTCLLSIELMILSIYQQKAAVAQQKAYKMNGFIFAQSLLTKVNEHLVSRRCIKHMLINPPASWIPVDLAGFLKVVNVIA